MATTEESRRILTIEVNGVKESVASIDQLADGIERLREEQSKYVAGSKEYNAVGKQISAAEKELKRLTATTKDAATATAQVGNQSQGAFGKLSGGLKSGIEGFGALKIAIAATGFGLLVQVLGQVVGWLTKFDTVGDFVEKKLAGINAAISTIIEPIAKLLTFDFAGFAESLSGIGGRLLDNAAAAEANTAALQELGDREAELATQQAKLAGEVERYVIQAKDRTKSEAERLALLDKAGAAEEQYQREAIDLAKQRADAEVALARAQGARLEEGIVRGGENEEQTRKAQAALKALQDQENEGARLQERIQLRRNQLVEAEAAEREKAAQAAREATQKRIDQIARLQSLEQDLILARLAGEEGLAAEEAKLRANREKEEIALRARRLKGETDGRTESLIIEAKYSADLAKLRKADADRRQAEEAKRLADEEAARQKATQERIAAIDREAEAEQGRRALEIKAEQDVINDTRRSFAERINAAEALETIEIERINAERERQLAREGLNQSEVALINETADAAIETANTTADTAIERLNELGGGFFGRLFGVENEEQQAQLFEVLAQAQALAEEIFASVLDGFAAQADEFAAQADAQAEAAAAARERVSNLTESLNKADMSQRAAIIAQIKAEQQAEEQAAQREAALRNKERQERNRISVIQKAIDLAEAGSAAALAVIKALGTVPPASFAFAAAAAGIATANVAFIAGRPVPQFAKGGYTGSGFGVPDSTGYKVAGVVHGGEYVMPAWMMATRWGAQQAQAIESRRVRGYAAGGVVAPTEVATDVSDMESAFTRALAKMPPPVVSIMQVDAAQIERRQVRVSARL